ncbi:MAG TPA: hypothetical protein VFE72_02550 [Lysobacter sp.]|nr:hypothetical protein [Lysobacter sp.]
MKKKLWTSLAAAGLLLASSVATAGPGDVFEVWGSGYTFWEARADARAAAQQICQRQGYAGAYVEDVDAAYGGLVVYYGLATCY